MNRMSGRLFPNRTLLRAAFLFAFSLILLVACSADSRTSLGNSAESGNPEIAGVVRFPDGSPAAFSKVAVVSSAFSARDGELLDSAWIKTADSLGRYAFARVPGERFTLEALDTVSGKRFVRMGLQMEGGSPLEVDGVLENVGSVRMGAHGFEDGTRGFVYVPGTTILRPATVELGNIFVDSLPADSLFPLVFVSDDGYALSLEKGVKVVSDSVVEVDENRVSLGFRFPLDLSAQKIELTEDLRNFPLMLRLDSSDADFRGMERIRGVWTAVLCGDTLALDNSHSNFEKSEFAFWVRIPKLRFASVDTLYLYFDEGERSYPDSSKRVFSDGFVAAYHFDEGDSSVVDATGNGFDGVPESLSVADEAVSGSALRYGGKSGSVTIPNSSSGDFDVTLREPISFSVWVKMDDLNQSRVVFGKGASQYHLMYLHGTETSSWLYEVYLDETLDTASNSTRYWYVDSVSRAGEWTHLAISQDSLGVFFYVNGALADSVPRIGTSGTVRSTDSLFVIGKLVYPADDPTDIVTHYFKGVIDELFISREARSVSWVRASFANQNPAARWPIPEAVRR